MHCMTVHIKEGRATIPLWAAIALAISVIMAAVGWVALASEKANNAQHEVLHQQIEAEDARLVNVEKAVEAIPQIQKDVAVITAIITERDGKK